MEKDKMSTEDIVKFYREDLYRLMRYLPYFEGKKAKDVSRMYSGEEMGAKLMSFPVYDSTLLSFVKEAGNTVFIDKNYRYVYTRHNIRTHQDEIREIDKASLRDMDVLCGIMSKYVLGGMTKAALWSEAVEYGIFYHVIDKARTLIEFWDRKADKSQLNG